MSRTRLLLTLIITALIPLTAILYHRLNLSLSLNSLSLQFTSPANHPQTTPDAMSAAAAAAVSHPPAAAAAVIVVGSGLAGLTASLSALRAGARSVILLERSPKPGGNSIKASSGINACPTRFQGAAAAPVGDSAAAFFADTARSAGRRLQDAGSGQAAARERLIAQLTDSSRAALEFLTGEDVGVDLSRVAQLGGHSFARTHRGAGKTPPGAAIVSALLGKLKENERFELRTGCEVLRLLQGGESGGDGAEKDQQQQQGRRRRVVTGVEYRNLTGPNADTASTPSPQSPQLLHGPVVFATGGFAGDATGLLATHRPDLLGMPSTNDARPASHPILELAGSILVDMSAVQIHPTGFVDPAHPWSPVKFLAAEMLRGEGGILLHEGRRFVNEMDTREHVSDAIMGLPRTADTPPGQEKQWDVQILLDPGACDAAGAHIGFYTWKGLMKKVPLSSLDATTQATVREYSAIAAGRREDKFGRRSFGHWRLKGEASADDEGSEEVCIGSITPVTHFTMGGAVINDRAQILASGLGDEEQVPVEGLWAAGEITGGIHGDNRLGGSSLLECVVFGLVAGEQAAKALAT